MSVSPPDGASVVGEWPHRALKGVAAKCDGGRNGWERFPRSQSEPPMVFSVGGTKQGEIGV